ncbi:MAG TPA: cohesin domain-containing protein [Candidatus Angelobacter sp.]|nr:cohesin domain-containing protein [Candidatus Angelobacter sp.]
MRKVTGSLVILILLAAILSAADSAKSLYQKGVKAEARADYEAAFENYKAAYQAKPEELKYRVSYERMRMLASGSKVKRGQKLRDQGNLQDALTLFQQAVEIDPSNDLAAQEVRRTQQMMQKKPSGGGQAAGPAPVEEDPLLKRLENSAPPVSLAPLPEAPISALELTNDSKVAYETIAKLAGVNVLFDPDYTPRQVTLRLHNVSLQEALDIVALQSRTFWRPVTPNTIFVAQDTQAKRRELEQNVVKTFYLGNVSTPTDLQDIVNAIRTVLEVQRIQQIPSQNAIVIKGTPDQLALASKMIDDIDKSKPEVVVDVVVAQVRRDKLRNLGITPPQTAQVALQSTNTVTPTPTGGGTTTTTTSSGPNLNFNDLQHLNSTNYAVTIDSLKAVAVLSDADTKIMQSPRIRATDNEKATLTIADKIPIATGSFGTPLGVGTAVGAVGVNTQFTYTDVGVKMEIQPRVHPDGQVTLKLSMEISNLNGSETIGGITQPIISTRKAEQVIRLADGEINLLGGILEVQDTKTVSGTPLLGEIPILKYLFSSTQKEHIVNELVFLLIPHIVRGQELNDLNRRAFDVGTGSGIDLRIAAKPAAPPQAAPAPVNAVAQPQPAAPLTPGRQQTTQAPAEQPQTPAPQAQPQQPAAPSQPVQQNLVQQNLKPGQVGLRLDPGSLSSQQGSSFNVAVTVAHGQDIAAVPIQITYDPGKVQFSSVTNGEFLAKDGQQVLLVHRDDASSGKLQITAQRPAGAEGVSGDGTVFNLVFTAKSKGTSSIAITVPGARNSQNQALDVLGSQMSITVN